MSTSNVYQLHLESSSGAACLDGSPYLYYFVPSSTASSAWTIQFQGGGWCTNEEKCLRRAQTALGSSTARKGDYDGCFCKNVESAGIVNTCNCLYLPYCDGASFSGNRTSPWPVPGHPGQYLHFRGALNLKGVIDHALNNLRLKDASSVVVAGKSAGGLSALLHVDRIMQMLRQHNQKVRGTALVSSGYFLDIPTLNASSQNFSSEMQYVYNMQDIGAETLGPECLSAYPETPHFCFMAPYMQQFVQAPFYLVSSKYDSYQAKNILQLGCLSKEPLKDRSSVVCSKEEHAAFAQMGRDFICALLPVLAHSKNGAFITSCSCHDPCPYSVISVDNTSYRKHYAAWYTGKTNTRAHIDWGGPNQDGALTRKSDACMVLP